MAIRNLTDLFQHHVQDLYNAEAQLEKAAPALMDAAEDECLKQALEKHGAIIGDNRRALREIANEMDFQPTGEKCHAMEGLIKEASKFLQEKAEQPVRDLGIISEADRVAHYFIAAYDVLCDWSRQLELSEYIQENCEKCLTNVRRVDEKLLETARDSMHKLSLN